MWQRLQQSYEVLPVRRRWKSLSWILPSRVRVFFILGSNWIIDFIFVVVGGFCDRTLDRNPVWQRLQQSYEVLPVRRRWKSLTWILPSRVLVFFKFWDRTGFSTSFFVVVGGFCDPLTRRLDSIGRSRQTSANRKQKRERRRLNALAPTQRSAPLLFKRKTISLAHVDNGNPR